MKLGFNCDRDYEPVSQICSFTFLFSISTIRTL